MILTLSISCSPPYAVPGNRTPEIPHHPRPSLSFQAVRLHKILLRLSGVPVILLSALPSFFTAGLLGWWRWRYRESDPVFPSMTAVGDAPPLFRDTTALIALQKPNGYGRLTTPFADTRSFKIRRGRAASPASPTCPRLSDSPMPSRFSVRSTSCTEPPCCCQGPCTLPHRW